MIKYQEELDAKNVILTKVNYLAEKADEQKL